MTQGLPLAAKISEVDHAARFPQQRVQWLQYLQGVRIELASILEEMIRGAKILHAESHGRIAWATTFDPRPFETPGFTDRVIAALQRDFSENAIAVKIWKTIGMAIRFEIRPVPDAG
jgi:hypothetical protein